MVWRVTEGKPVGLNGETFATVVRGQVLAALLLTALAVPAQQAPSVSTSRANQRGRRTRSGLRSL